MKHYLLLLILFTLLAGCNGSSQKTPVAEADTIDRIFTPFREHGYNNLNTLILGTESELQNFMALVESQDNWNNKSDFLTTLGNTTIDFEQFNLLLFRITETSGSIALTPQLPEQSGSNVIVNIERDVPEVGTDDMAYYALVYQVNKSVVEVHFDNGTQNAVIKNSPGTNIVPENCSAWFDGCNTCTRAEDDQIICSLKACAIYGEQYCTLWQN